MLNKKSLILSAALLGAFGATGLTHINGNAASNQSQPNQPKATKNINKADATNNKTTLLTNKNKFNKPVISNTHKRMITDKVASTSYSPNDNYGDDHTETVHRNISFKDPRTNRNYSLPSGTKIYGGHYGTMLSNEYKDYILGYIGPASNSNSNTVLIPKQAFKYNNYTRTNSQDTTSNESNSTSTVNNNNQLPQTGESNNLDDIEIAGLIMSGLSLAAFSLSDKRKQKVLSIKRMFSSAI